jgi:hypothetical protein
MARQDQNAPDPEPDPTEDTPDPEAEEGAEAEVQPEPDQRLAEKDALISRQAQELALFRRQAAAADEAPSEAAGSDPSLTALEADSWTLAEQVYGGDAIEAYRTAADLLEKAVTPADYMAAFEAYHQIRTEGPAAEPASDKPTRAQATAPKVDANRSDLGPDPDIEQKLSEARKGKSLVDFANAATQAMGFGRSKS